MWAFSSVLLRWPSAMRQMGHSFTVPGLASARGAGARCTRAAGAVTGSVCRTLNGDEISMSVPLVCDVAGEAEGVLEVEVVGALCHVLLAPFAGAGPVAAAAAALLN